MGLHPWSRRADESSKSYGYFQMFLDLGVVRSIVKVAERCGKNASRLYRLASRFDWHERAIAFDNYQAEQSSRQLVARRAQAQARQADRAVVLSDTAIVAARRLVGRLQADQNAELTPDQITGMFSAASRVEATALGFGKEGVSVNVGVNVNPPRPVVSEEVALRMAAAFIWEKHPDPEVQEFARRVCNALMPGAQEAEQ